MTAPFTDNLKPQLPGTDGLYLQQQLDLTVEEFLKKTLLWKQELGPYDLDPEEPTFEFSLTQPVRYVAHIHEVWLDETKLRPKIINKPSELWDTGTPSYYMPKLPEAMMLWPVPETFYMEQLRIIASVYPRSADNAPAWLGERYLEEIMSGVFARMMLQPDKPYSNSTLGTYHHKKFQNALRSGKRAAMNTFQFGAQNWSFPYFAGNER